MTSPPTLRAWVAGLVECTAALVERVGGLVEHLALGLDLVADAIAPPPSPTRTTTETGMESPCLCGPTARVSMTGRGDVWHIRHHPLTPAPRRTSDHESLDALPLATTQEDQ